MGEVRERAARVQGDEVVREQRVGGSGGGEVAGLEEVAVELLPLGERAGGGERDEEVGQRAREGRQRRAGRRHRRGHRGLQPAGAPGTKSRRGNINISAFGLGQPP